MPAGELMTAEEYMSRPGLKGRPTNLVDGELVTSEPTELHQRIVWRLVVALGNWVDSGADRGRPLLPIDVLVDDHNVYAPDILWYAPSRALPDPATPPYPVPDLAVEIRSPSTWRYDIGTKKAGYERAGLRELWLVDTGASAVLVFRRSTPDATTFDIALERAGRDALVSPLLPGFALSVAVLFAD